MVDLTVIYLAETHRDIRMKEAEAYRLAKGAKYRPPIAQNQVRTTNSEASPARRLSLKTR